MNSKLLRSVAASALLAVTVTLGGCATIPTQPTWSPAEYPVFQTLPPPPVYAARPVPDVPPAVMQMQPPTTSGGHSWGHDAALAGAGVIGGTQLAKRFGSGAAAGEAEGALTTGEALGGAAEGLEGAEALEGLGAIIEEWWWLAL